MITVASNFGSLAARQPALGLSKHHPHKDQIHWLGWDSNHKAEGHVDGLDELSEEDIMWGDEVQDQHKMMQHHHYHIHHHHQLHQPHHRHAPAQRHPHRSLLTAEMEKALSNNNGDTGPQYGTGPKAPQGLSNHALQASIYDASSSSSTSALSAAGNSKQAHDDDNGGGDDDDDDDADDGFHVNHNGHEVDQASKHKFKHGQEGGGDHVLVPPHEMLAREYASSSFSVLQGTGRTLKGMDLRRMRNAVWMRTGFLD